MPGRSVELPSKLCPLTLGIDVAIGRLDFCLLASQPWRLLLPHARAASAGELLHAIAPLTHPHGLVAGVDAPLTLPSSGVWRQCDRELIRRGIPCYPPLAKTFAPVARFAMGVVEELRTAGVECVEVYPYAARVLLQLAPSARKATADGRAAIRCALQRYVRLQGLPEVASHHALDAIIAGLTAGMYVAGRFQRVEGPDGAIVLPLPPVP